MRVVCIDDSKQYRPPFVKRGNIYTVSDKKHIDERRRKDGNTIYLARAGEYYKFFETGAEMMYKCECFLPINEDQQDETEMDRNYKIEKV